MKISTSLARQALAILRTQLRANNDMGLAVYSGDVPVDADAPIPNNGGGLLGWFSDAGNPIDFATPTNNTVGIAPGAVWTCQPLAAGTATYFRVQQRYTDGNGQVGYDTAPTPRLQGTVGTSGADLIMADPVFTPGTAKEIRNFLLTLPLAS
ncbi:MAG: hypothetical protein EOO78_28275 [Oxalobacteraceae bacterium]|nr:MAG: hypothetical protein EOO78_28275 [Oxalobacteraceae bacterium]